jgi:hypothetical protein
MHLKHKPDWYGPKMITNPPRGAHHVHIVKCMVMAHRKKTDFAVVCKELDRMFPVAHKITLVCDNLNTHPAGLQVKWAAHLSYATATRLLSEVLPVTDTISISGVERRVRVVGAALEQAVGQNAQTHLDLQGRTELAPPTKRPAITALAVGSGWLRHCDPPRHQGRHVNLVAGRACFEGGKTRLYVHPWPGRARPTSAWASRERTDGTQYRSLKLPNRSG